MATLHPCVQIGCALGFVIPPEIVTNDEDVDVIGSQLRLMLYSGAVVMTILFMLVLLRTLHYCASHHSSLSTRLSACCYI